MIAYLSFAGACFTTPMLTSSGWAEVLHVRELAVGAAAINSLSQIGAFVTPYVWGVAKDRTGGYQLGLIALVAMSASLAALLLVVRREVRGGAPSKAFFLRHLRG
jgi:ACS family tartrate transporter-like MFS transporter